MAWPPVQYEKSYDESPLAANLLAYIEANQTDALTWANGGPGLSDFKKTYNSVSGRASTIFPNLLVASSSAAENPASVTECAFVITLEGAILGPNPDTLTTDCATYVKALKSIMLNIPIGTLTAGTDTPSVGWCDGIETSYDEIGNAGSARTSFLQIFQIRVTYRLTASPQ